MTTPFEILSKYNLEQPQSIIQVGASGGQELQQFIDAGIKDALLIEPLNMPFEILSNRVSAFPNYLAFKTLITSRNGKDIDFFVASNGGMSSSILEPNHHLDLYPQVLFPEKVTLTGFRLDSVVKLLFTQNKIRFEYSDMLYLDVQGAEIYVLKGAGEILDELKYVWTEVGLGQGYSGGASYSDVINFMHAYDFQLIYFECEPGAFGDALFVKNKK